MDGALKLFRIPSMIQHKSLHESTAPKGSVQTLSAGRRGRGCKDILGFDQSIALNVTHQDNIDDAHLPLAMRGIPNMEHEPHNLMTDLKARIITNISTLNQLTAIHCSAAPRDGAMMSDT